MTAYEPYSEPVGQDPQVSQRAGDGLWLVWVWKPMPELPLSAGGFLEEGDPALPYAPWTLHTRCWHTAAVLGSKAKAERWVKRYQERRKR